VLQVKKQYHCDVFDEISQKKRENKFVFLEK